MINQKRDIRNSFKIGWFIAQASLELNMKESGLAMGISIESVEGIKWEHIPINRA